MIEKHSNIRQMTRSAQPLIHCITNPISIHDCANIILAAGGRPIMAEHPAEVAEITSHSQALALNLGNITDVRMESMPKSLETASRLRIPVMLDLVGTACSNLRYEFAQRLMSIHMPKLLKGNMSELLAMSGQTAHAIGIDAGTQDVLTNDNRSRLKDLFPEEKQSQWKYNTPYYRKRRHGYFHQQVRIYHKWHFLHVTDYRNRLHAWNDLCHLSGSRRSFHCCFICRNRIRYSRRKSRKKTALVPEASR